MTQVNSKQDGILPKLLPIVAQAVKLSQDLPIADTPAYVYYNDFPKYKAIATGQSKKILTTIQKTLDILDAKANVLDVSAGKGIREKFSSVVDANDKLLERLSKAMDIEEDPSRRDTSSADNLLVAVYKNNQANKTSDSMHVSSTEAAPAAHSFRLLTSSQIRRPQSAFTKPPDNSQSPFRPNLADKPNSILPLSESVKANLPDDEESPHPYSVELDAFAKTLSDWRPIIYHGEAPLWTDDYCFVDNPTLLAEVIAELAAAPEVAVDLEHHSHRTYLGLTCLIQLSTRQKDYIVDALALRDHVQKLNQVFTNPRIVKIFHGSDSDLLWLQRDFSVYVVNLFDTGVAARALQLGRHSLSYLLHHYANTQTDKKYQLADWRIRPLPDELVKYARIDTHYLIPIAAQMCAELQDRNLLPTVLEKCLRMCLQRYKKPVFDPLGFWSLYRHTARNSFTHRQLYALEQLYSLRDSIARHEDESTFYVLPNHMLKVIADVLPRESSGLFACCNPIPPLVRKYVHDFHKIILDARSRPLDELPILSSLESLKQVTPEEVDAIDQSMDQSEMPPTIAPPHDRSTAQSKQPSSWPDSSLLKKSPSNLGRAMTTGFSASSHSESFEDVNADQRYLEKLIDLVSRLMKYPVDQPNQEISTKPPQSAAPVPPVPVPKESAETIIPIEVKDDVSEEGELRVEDDLSSDSSDKSPALKKEKLDPEKVIIIREEMVGRSKRKRKKQSSLISGESVAQIPVGPNTEISFSSESGNPIDSYAGSQEIHSPNRKVSKSRRSRGSRRKS